MSLNLEPNEIVGYRIKPDWHSFNVVLIKRHGPASSNPGQEYDTPLAYCKDLPFAVRWLVSHAVRMQGELNQRDQARVNGSVADAQALLSGYEAAQEYARGAVAELQARIDASGLCRKELVKCLRTAEATPL